MRKTTLALFFNFIGAPERAVNRRELGIIFRQFPRYRLGHPQGEDGNPNAHVENEGDEEYEARVEPPV